MYQVGYLQDIFKFFIDLIKYALEKIGELLLEALTAIFEILPDPCCVKEAVSMFRWLSNSLHSGGHFSLLSWVFDVIDFEFGFRVILCTLIARFIIRRLPGIG
ncbi:hypothetical protein [Methylomonas koyamae]|uniref:hypothetical protein n=1 Tax=Methylomonas koyamae TaxID=702114 RepID=UPI0006D17624|nr:hypothetical protein [Methylomonas koyamae]BBL58145.1 hypothetical protein MKFW12EY_17580 [Methylomonas koyamae]